jgi:hypothetical protein
VRTGSASAVFNATVVAQATSITKISGDSQIAVVGQQFRRRW